MKYNINRKQVIKIISFYLHIFLFKIYELGCMSASLLLALKKL